MTSSNGNIFRVTGHLCGEFTGDRWIRRTKASGAELWCFLRSAPWINGWVNNREAGDLRCHRGHYDVIVMISQQASTLAQQGNNELILQNMVHKQSTYGDVMPWKRFPHNWHFVRGIHWSPQLSFAVCRNDLLHKHPWIETSWRSCNITVVNRVHISRDIIFVFLVVCPPYFLPFYCLSENNWIHSHDSHSFQHVTIVHVKSFNVTLDRRKL